MQLDSRTRRCRSISLTPLIDVVFILLLFFMITTRFGQEQGISISVPVDAASQRSTDEQSLRIRLIAEGSVQLGDAIVGDMNTLRGRAAVLDALASGIAVVVDSDDDVDLQTFTRLIDVLSALGLENISFQGLQ